LTDKKTFLEPENNTMRWWLHKKWEISTNSNANSFKKSWPYNRELHTNVSWNNCSSRGKDRHSRCNVWLKKINSPKQKTSNIRKV